MKDFSLRKVINFFGVAFLTFFLVALTLSFLKRGIWNDQMGLNILVVGDESVGLLILRPKESLGSWVVLPSDLKIKISGSQASYPINSIWKFGEGEKAAIQISEKSIGEAMGVIIPRLIRIDGEAAVESVLGSLLSLSAKTDMSMLDRLAVRKYLSEVVSSKRLLEQSLPQQVYEKVQEPDGKIFKIFSQVMNAWSKDKFLFDSVLSENSDLTINNLSGTSGMGLIMARQAETAGMRVIEVKNDPEDKVAGKGCVFESPNVNEKSIELLQNHFGCKRLRREGENGGEIKVWLL